MAFNNFSPDVSAQAYLRQIFPAILFSVTQVVAICTAVEEFFQHGARWRQYRTTAESLKSEGWQFFQLGGAYRQSSTHLQAYPSFSTRVERIICRDVQVYLSEIAKDQQREEEDPSGGGGGMNLSPLQSGFFTNLGNTAPFPITEILGTNTQVDDVGDDEESPPRPKRGDRPT